MKKRSTKNLSILAQALILSLCFVAYLNANATSKKDDKQEEGQAQYKSVTNNDNSEERRDAMNVKKMTPWNWFKSEEPTGSQQLTTHNPSRAYPSMRDLHRDIDHFIDHAFRNFGFPTLGPDLGFAHAFKPKMDIQSSDTAYTLAIELPGVNENDMHLEVVDDTLTIKGEKKQAFEKKEKDAYRVERSYGSFQRVLTLPQDVDQEAIDARFKNGVLTVSLPRKEAVAPDSRKIDIKTES